MDEPEEMDDENMEAAAAVAAPSDLPPESGNVSQEVYTPRVGVKISEEEYTILVKKYDSQMQAFHRATAVYKIIEAEEEWSNNDHTRDLVKRCVMMREYWVNKLKVLKCLNCGRRLPVGIMGCIMCACMSHAYCSRQCMEEYIVAVHHKGPIESFNVEDRKAYMTEGTGCSYVMKISGKLHAWLRVILWRFAAVFYGVQIEKMYEDEGSLENFDIAERKMGKLRSKLTMEEIFHIFITTDFCGQLVGKVNKVSYENPEWYLIEPTEFMIKIYQALPGIDIRAFFFNAMNVSLFNYVPGKNSVIDLRTYTSEFSAKSSRVLSMSTTLVNEQNSMPKLDVSSLEVAHVNTLYRIFKVVGSVKADDGTVKAVDDPDAIHHQFEKFVAQVYPFSSISKRSLSVEASYSTSAMRIRQVYRFSHRRVIECMNSHVHIALPAAIEKISPRQIFFVKQNGDLPCDVDTCLNLDTGSAWEMVRLFHKDGLYDTGLVLTKYGENAPNSLVDLAILLMLQEGTPLCRKILAVAKSEHGTGTYNIIFSQENIHTSTILMKPEKPGFGEFVRKMTFELLLQYNYMARVAFNTKVRDMPHVMLRYTESDGSDLCYDWFGFTAMLIGSVYGGAQHGLKNDEDYFDNTYIIRTAQKEPVPCLLVFQTNNEESKHVRDFPDLNVTLGCILQEHDANLFRYVRELILNSVSEKDAPMWRDEINAFAAEVERLCAFRAEDNSSGFLIEMAHFVHSTYPYWFPPSYQTLFGNDL